MYSIASLILRKETLTVTKGVVNYYWFLLFCTFKNMFGTLGRLFITFWLFWVTLMRQSVTLFVNVCVAGLVAIDTMTGSVGWLMRNERQPAECNSSINSIFSKEMCIIAPLVPSPSILGDHATFQITPLLQHNNPDCSPLLCHGFFQQTISSSDICPLISPLSYR